MMITTFPVTPISALRQQLIEDMNIRRFSRPTQRNYIRDVGRSASFLRLWRAVQFQAPRGGYGTKACVITDAIGRAVAFVLAPGQAHELPHAMALLDHLPGVPGWVVADRGHSSHAFREHI